MASTELQPHLIQEHPQYLNGKLEESGHQPLSITMKRQGRGLFGNTRQAVTRFVIGAAVVAMGFYPAKGLGAIRNPAAMGASDDAGQQSLTLRQISRMDQLTFEHSMPQLLNALGQPKSNVVVGPETLTSIAVKLRQTSETTPDYWPVVLRFIPFASSIMAKGAPPPAQQPRVLSDILSVGLMRGIREFGKTILLDDGYLGNGEFTNCRIIFTPNAVRLTNAHFKNCVFELPNTDPPNNFIKKVSRILLSSNLSSVSMPSL